MAPTQPSGTQPSGTPPSTPTASPPSRRLPTGPAATTLAPSPGLRWAAIVKSGVAAAATVVAATVVAAAVMATVATAVQQAPGTPAAVNRVDSVAVTLAAVRAATTAPAAAPVAVAAPDAVAPPAVASPVVAPPAVAVTPGRPAPPSPNPGPPPSPASADGDPRTRAGVDGSARSPFSVPPPGPSGASTAPGGSGSEVPGAPPTGAAAAAGPGSGGPARPAGGGAAGGGPSWWDIPGQAAAAVGVFLLSLVSGGAVPVASLLGLLLDPSRLVGLDRLRQLWEISRTVADELLVVMVLFGGFTVLSYGSLQTRWAGAEILPRIFLAGAALNCSWLIVTTGVSGCVELAVTLAGQGMTPAQVLGGLLIQTANGGGVFLALLSVVALLAAVVLALSLVVTTVVLCLLIVAAPLALLAHALPQTEALAFAWWRALRATLTVPLVHGLTVALAARVLFTPDTGLGTNGTGTRGAVTGPASDTGTVTVAAATRPGGGVPVAGADGSVGGLFGAPSPGGALLDLVVLLAVLWVMIKVPFWAWSTIKASNPLTSSRSGSLLGKVAKTVLAVQTLGAVGAALGVSAAAGTAAGASGAAGGGLSAVLGGLSRSRGPVGVLSRAGLAAQRRHGAAGSTNPGAGWPGVANRLREQARRERRDHRRRGGQGGAGGGRPGVGPVTFRAPGQPPAGDPGIAGSSRGSSPARGTVLPEFLSARSPGAPTSPTAAEARVSGRPDAARAPLFQAPGGPARVPTRTPRIAPSPGPETASGDGAGPAETASRRDRARRGRGVPTFSSPPPVNTPASTPGGAGAGARPARGPAVFLAPTASAVAPPPPAPQWGTPGLFAAPRPVSFSSPDPGVAHRPAISVPDWPHPPPVAPPRARVRFPDPLPLPSELPSETPAPPPRSASTRAPRRSATGATGTGRSGAGRSGTAGSGAGRRAGSASQKSGSAGRARPGTGQQPRQQQRRQQEPRRQPRQRRGPDSSGGER